MKGLGPDLNLPEGVQWFLILFVVAQTATLVVLIRKLVGKSAAKRTEPDELPLVRPPEPLIGGFLPQTETGDHGFMLQILNVIDEIALSEANAESGAKAIMMAQRERLEDKLELAGAEILRFSDWDPALQRAVEVKPANADQTDIRVLQTLAVGLRISGRLIRKQEVIISRP